MFAVFATRRKMNENIVKTESYIEIMSYLTYCKLQKNLS